MKLTTKKSLLATAVLGAITASTVAQAQLEEVVVTAERREASIQDTPISMEAFTAEGIQRRGISNIGDLFTSTAGVQGYEAPSARGNISLNIRGVGSGNSNSPSTDPANALYVDGVYIGKGIANGVDAIDLERIEILRGPQGTLYGRNSTGGAVNFITRKPGEDFGLTLQATAGNFDLGGIKGRIDLPVTDNLSVSASFYNRSRDNLYENTNSGVDGFESLGRDGYRFAARWTPTETFTADYSYARDEIDETSQMINVVGLSPTNASVLFEEGFPTNVTIESAARPNTVAAIGGGVAQLLQFGLFPPLPQLNQFVGWTNDYVAWANERLENYDDRTERGSSDLTSYNLSKVDHHNLTLSWAFSDSMELKSITGYRDSINEISADLDGMDNSAVGGVIGDLPLSTIGGLLFNQVVPDSIPLFPGVDLGLDAGAEFQLALKMIDAINEFGGAPVFNNYAKTDYSQFSQEFQLSGSTDNLNYVVGLFYYEDDAKFRNHRIASFPLATSDTSSYDTGTEAYSVFGEATWRFDDWALTGGLRYTDETKDITYLWRGYNSNFINRYYEHLFAGGSMATYDLMNNYVTNEEAMSLPERQGIYGKTFEQDFTNVSGRLTAQYFVNDDINVYATVSTGYRSGGFNGDFYDTVNDSADGYDEEVMTNYEIGFKSTLLDGTAQLNATVFMYTYEDLQVSTVLAQGNTVTSAIGNAGETERSGLEASFTWQPIDNLVGTIGWVHMEGDFEQYPGVTAGNSFLPLDNIARRGLSPDDQVTYSIDWNLLNAGQSSVTLSLNGAWQSATTSIPVATGVYDTDGIPSSPDTPVAFELRENQERLLVNTRLAWDYEMDSGNMFSVGIWGMNITDEEYRSFGYSYGPGLGLNVHQYGSPRTYGVDFTLNL